MAIRSTLIKSIVLGTPLSTTGAQGIVWNTNNANYLVKTYAPDDLPKGMDLEGARKLMARRYAVFSTRRFEADTEVASLPLEYLGRIEANDGSGTTPAYLMRKAIGADLEITTNFQTKYPYEARLRMARSLSHGLLRVHGAGVIHADFKPNNFILNERDCVIQIIDIDGGGFEGHVNGKLDAFPPIVRMPNGVYAAPEFALGVKSWADAWDNRNLRTQLELWSLAVMIYQLLVNNQGPFPSRDNPGTEYFSKKDYCKNEAVWPKPWQWDEMRKFGLSFSVIETFIKHFSANKRLQPNNRFLPMDWRVILDNELAQLGNSKRIYFSVAGWPPNAETLSVLPRPSRESTLFGVRELRFPNDTDVTLSARSTTHTLSRWENLPPGCDGRKMKVQFKLQDNLTIPIRVIWTRYRNHWATFALLLMLVGSASSYLGVQRLNLLPSGFAYEREMLVAAFGGCCVALAAAIVGIVFAGRHGGRGRRMALSAVLIGVASNWFTVPNLVRNRHSHSEMLQNQAKITEGAQSATAVSAAGGWVAFNSDPPNTEFQIAFQRGQQTIKPPEICGPYPATNYAFHAILNGQPWQTLTAVVENGKTNSITFNFNPASVVITTEPAEATILDGTNTVGRASPFLRLANVSPGVHTYTAKLAGYNPVSTNLMLQPGQEVSVALRSQGIWTELIDVWDQMGARTDQASGAEKRNRWTQLEDALKQVQADLSRLKNVKVNMPSDVHGKILKASEAQTAYMDARNAIRKLLGKKAADSAADMGRLLIEELPALEQSDEALQPLANLTGVYKSIRDLSTAAVVAAKVVEFVQFDLAKLANEKMSFSDQRQLLADLDARMRANKELKTLVETDISNAWLDLKRRAVNDVADATQKQDWPRANATLTEVTNISQAIGNRK